MPGYTPTVKKQVPLNKSIATASQKENFRVRFAEIVRDNVRLRDKYNLNFFETAQKSNYVFTGFNGNSLNVISLMTMEEAENYRKLKKDWQD